MRVLSGTSILEALCKASHKWGMLLHMSFGDYNGASITPKEMFGAVPYLDPNKHLQFYMDEQGILLFDTENEMKVCFQKTVGDDGPTKFNSYSGPARCYAITCSPDGDLLNENT